MTGYIHSFESMGAVDGPGLRFVVFMQGCPMRCLYCHNPDTWQFGAGNKYTAEEVAETALRYKNYIKNNKLYNNLKIIHNDKFHDRFIIVIVYE